MRLIFAILLYFLLYNFAKSDVNILQHTVDNSSTKISRALSNKYICEDLKGTPLSGIDFGAFTRETEPIEPDLISKTPHFIFKDDQNYLTLKIVHIRTDLQNSFGYFTYDNTDGSISEYTIWEKAPDNLKDSSLCLSVGDSFTIGPFRKDQVVGFWIRNFVGVERTYYSFQDQSAFMNIDSLDHFAWFSLADLKYTFFMFEDGFYQGDRDFNDLILLFENSKGIDLYPVPTFNLKKQPRIVSESFHTLIEYNGDFWSLTGDNSTSVNGLHQDIIPNGFSFSLDDPSSIEIITKFGPEYFFYFDENACIILLGIDGAVGYHLNGEKCDQKQFTYEYDIATKVHTVSENSAILIKYTEPIKNDYVMNCDVGKPVSIIETPALKLNQYLDYSPLSYTIQSETDNTIPLKINIKKSIITNLRADVLYIIDTSGLSKTDLLAIKTSGEKLISSFSASYHTNTSSPGVLIGIAYYVSNGDQSPRYSYFPPKNPSYKQEKINESLSVLDSIDSPPQENSELYKVASIAISNYKFRKNVFRIVVILTNNIAKPYITEIKSALEMFNTVLLVYNPDPKINPAWLKNVQQNIPDLYFSGISQQDVEISSSSIWDNVFTYSIARILKMQSLTVPYSSFSSTILNLDFTAEDLDLSINYGFNLITPSKFDSLSGELSFVGKSNVNLNVSRYQPPIARDITLNIELDSKITTYVLPFNNTINTKLPVWAQVENFPYDDSRIHLIANGERILSDSLVPIDAKVCFEFFDNWTGDLLFQYKLTDKCRFGNAANVRIIRTPPKPIVQTLDFIVNGFVDDQPIIIDFNGKINISGAESIEYDKVSIDFNKSDEKCKNLNFALTENVTGQIKKIKISHKLPSKTNEKIECKLSYIANYEKSVSEVAYVTIFLEFKNTAPILEIGNTEFKGEFGTIFSINLKILDEQPSFEELLDLVLVESNLKTFELSYNSVPISTLGQNIKILEKKPIGSGGIQINLSCTETSNVDTLGSFTLQAIDSSNSKSNAITINLTSYAQSVPLFKILNSKDQYDVADGETIKIDLVVTSPDYFHYLIYFEFDKIPENGKLNIGNEPNISLVNNSIVGPGFPVKYPIPSQLILTLEYTNYGSSKDEFCLSAIKSFNFKSDSLCLLFNQKVKSILVSSRNLRINAAPLHPIIINIPAYPLASAKNSRLRIVKIANKKGVIYREKIDDTILNPSDDAATWDEQSKSFVLNYIPPKLSLLDSMGLTSETVSNSDGKLILATRIIFQICDKETSACSIEYTLALYTEATYLMTNTDDLFIESVRGENIDALIYRYRTILPETREHLKLKVTNSNSNQYFHDREFTQPISIQSLISYPYIVYFQSQDTEYSTKFLNFEIQYYGMVLSSEFACNVHYTNKATEDYSNTPIIEILQNQTYSITGNSKEYANTSAVTFRIESYPTNGYLYTCYYEDECYKLPKSDAFYTAGGFSRYLKYEPLPYGFGNDYSKFTITTYSRILLSSMINEFTINIPFNNGLFIIIPKFGEITNITKDDLNVIYEWRIHMTENLISKVTTKLSLEYHYLCSIWKIIQCQASEDQECQSPNEVFSSEDILNVKDDLLTFNLKPSMVIDSGCHSIDKTITTPTLTPSTECVAIFRYKLNISTPSPSHLVARTLFQGIYGDLSTSVVKNSIYSS